MIKIKPEEFNIPTLTHKFKAPHVRFIEGIFRENDPKEIFIPLNEFAYQIQKNKNFLEGCYWVEWIIEYDSISRKKKDKQIINIIPNNLDKIYKKIKTNEIAPKTDYLFHGVEQKSNQEKTAEKLAILNKLI